ncbi:MAG: glycine/sarcosine/betaine reductase component B subunit [Planctomycetota bacterium]|nr:glycine/sarcosine/betaine reductase component B subunit [Planctomycetota bacterium]
MAFEIGIIQVDDVALGERTALDGARLTVSADDLARELKAADDRIRELRVHLASSGSSTRIVCTKDVVQPRVKLEGERPGEGRMLALSGVAVVSCGPIVGFQEGIIDMSGPGAAYTPFSALDLIVLEVEVEPGLELHAHEEVLRMASSHAARWLAETARTAPAPSFTTYDSGISDPKLPRVGYVYLLQNQGLLHDTYVLGVNARQADLPRIVSPEVVLDDAIVSGNCVSACDKNTTYHHQNNPVVRELFRRHGTDLSFAGIVLSTEPVRLADKTKAAEGVLLLAKELDLDAAVISKEGFGNPDADLMMIIRGLEQAGIRTVAITDEYAGEDGGSQSLADATIEANAVVSTGNANEVLVLPPMERTIGPIASVERLAGGLPTTLREDGGLTVELQAMMGSTNELGFSRLRAREV